MEYSRSLLFHFILEYSRIFQKVTKYSKVLKNIQKYSKYLGIFWNILEYSGIIGKLFLNGTVLVSQIIPERLLHNAFNPPSGIFPQV